jgi:hypothetical protein
MRSSPLLILLVACHALGQASVAAPQQFRIVTPKGPGSITVNTAGWTVDRVVLDDHDWRAVIQLHSDSLGIIVSYMLSNDETFDYSKESCKNDVLGTVLEGPLKKATVKNKRNATRTLPDGQTLDIGSYLVVKNEGNEFNQQNVFGFIAQKHTCAEIHLSRMDFKEGEDQVFDATLNSFAFDPSYSPVPADFKAMAELLPPGMASAYGSAPPQSASDPLNTGQSLTFGLPNHPGYLHMDAPNFVITELSAKPNGHEFGIRAKDSTISDAEVLGFLFMPEPSQPTAAACRNWMLSLEKAGGVKDRKGMKTSEDKSDSGVPIALVEYEQSKAPASARYVLRFFVAQGDLCADVEVSASNLISIQTTSSLWKTLEFDPSRPPDFLALFRYAQVLYNHHQYAQAAPIFMGALDHVATVDDSTKWRRVTTDQASMAYGISGDLAKSRAINEAAIAKDPEYPFYYYNLACADAEAGDAAAAQKHLQEAYDRRANTLAGEHLPDAAKDDSIVKLKKDKAFWAFVEGLPKP